MNKNSSIEGIITLLTLIFLIGYWIGEYLGKNSQLKLTENKETNLKLSQIRKSSERELEITKILENNWEKHAIEASKEVGTLSFQVRNLSEEIQINKEITNLLFTIFSDRNYFLEEKEEGFILAYNYQNKILKSDPIQLDSKFALFDREKIERALSNITIQRYYWEARNQSQISSFCSTCQQGIPILEMGNIQPLNE